jgi:hypothetical protein
VLRGGGEAERCRGGPWPRGTPSARSRRSRPSSRQRESRSRLRERLRVRRLSRLRRRSRLWKERQGGRRRKAPCKTHLRLRLRWRYRERPSLLWASRCGERERERPTITWTEARIAKRRVPGRARALRAASGSAPPRPWGKTSKSRGVFACRHVLLANQDTQNRRLSPASKACVA